MVFVDTGAWFASLIPTDPDHASAVAWLTTNSSPLLTTDYVIDETLTLLRARGERKRALLLGERFFRFELSEIQKITDTDLKLAWKTFERFADKDWSFTDCTSKVVIEQLGITEAFAFDQHFKQFGTVQIVPYGNGDNSRDQTQRAITRTGLKSSSRRFDLALLARQCRARNVCSNI